MRLCGAVSLLAFLSVLAIGCAPGKEASRTQGTPGAAVSGGEEGEDKYTGPPKIEVEKALLLVAGNFLEVRFQMSGIEKLDPEPASTYAVDEATGTKFFVTWLRRIGRIGVTKQRSYQYLLFRIPEAKLKVGDRITVVVQGAKQEHVPVEGEL